MGDIYRCRRIVRGRECGEQCLQLVDQLTQLAFLLCPGCHHREDIARRDPPPTARWRSLTVTKPCLYPACRGLVTVPVTQPGRVRFCGRHPKSARKRLPRAAA